MAVPRKLAQTGSIQLTETINTLTRSPRLHSWLTRLSTIASPDAPAPVMLERLLSGELTVGERLRSACSRMAKRKGLPAWPSMGAAISGFGMETFREIALAVVFHCIVEDFEKKSGLSAKKSVQEAVAVATLTRALTRRVAPDLNFDSYCAGFLANLGVPFMAALSPQQYIQVAQQLDGGKTQLHQAEYQAFGHDHSMLGSVLLSDYEFSKRIADACGAHHEPARSADTSAAVALAETLAHQLGFGGAFAIAPPDFMPDQLTQFRTDESDLGELADETNNAVSDVTFALEL